MKKALIKTACARTTWETGICTASMIRPKKKKALALHQRPEFRPIQLFALLVGKMQAKI
eukprot:jgi/Bigna1/61451/fgenesh1_kg.22_\